MLIYPDLNWQQLFPRSYPPHSADFWEHTDLQHCSAYAGRQEPFCEVNELLDPDLIAAFGSSRPGSDQFLLHRAAGWDRNIHKTPLLLVHGAGLDASSFCNLWGMGYKGLQQQLLNLGYRVFAITFPHSHGDNYIQAEQLAAAIAQIKQVCGCEQINLIAHSKGGIAARIYLSGMSLTPYQGDVSSYIMLGTPNLGTDFAFRNPGAAYMVYLTGGNGVIPWDKINVMGLYIDISPRSIYNDGCFPGQNQILYRWEDRYPLDPTQPDWWSSYHGGQGFISHSRGIDKAIQDGDNLIQKLNQQPLPADISVSVLAGNKHLFWNNTPGDSSGPGDGIVFLDSALYTDGISAGGAKIKTKTVLALNHMELIYHYQVAAWINTQLQS